MQDSPRRLRTTIWATSYSTLLKEEQLKKQLNISMEMFNTKLPSSVLNAFQNAQLNKIATKVRNSTNLLKSTLPGRSEHENF